MRILSIYPYTHISSGTYDKWQDWLLFQRKDLTELNEYFFPLKSINWCLKKCKVKLKDIDLIVVP